jgi:2-oxoglutarate ferredoxin oxidoreductase subunit beta
MNDIKNNSMITNDLNEAKEKGKIAIGIFKNISLAEYTDEYQKIIDRFKK